MVEDMIRVICIGMMATGGIGIVLGMLLVIKMLIILLFERR